MKTAAVSSFLGQSQRCSLKKILKTAEMSSFLGQTKRCSQNKTENSWNVKFSGTNPEQNWKQLMCQVSWDKPRRVARTKLKTAVMSGFLGQTQRYGQNKTENSCNVRFSGTNPEVWPEQNWKQLECQVFWNKPRGVARTKLKTAGLSSLLRQT